MFVAPRGHRHGFSNPSAEDALVLGLWAPPEPVTPPVPGLPPLAPPPVDATAPPLPTLPPDPGVPSELLLQAMPTIDRAAAAIPHSQVTRASAIASAMGGSPALPMRGLDDTPGISLIDTMSSNATASQRDSFRRASGQ